MMQSVKISVIVPTYNAAATLPLTIKAILKQDYPQFIEIIIVDDGSTDDTLAVIPRVGQDKQHQIQIITQKNAGPAAARNHGAKIATGEILFFTDADCVPRPNWVSKMLSGFCNNRVAVVCGSYGIANPESCLAHCIHEEIQYRHCQLLPEYPQIFGSYNFCIKTAIFREVGHFDECYRFASGEDNDLSYRVIDHGYQIHFDRDACVDHFHPEKMVRYLREQSRHGYWRVRMYRKHPRMSRGDGYTFWKDILEILLALSSLISLAVAVLFHWDIGNFLLGISVAGLVLLEAIFSWRMATTLQRKILLFFVMLFRSYARTFGFIHGLGAAVFDQFKTSND